MVSWGACEALATARGGMNWTSQSNEALPHRCWFRRWNLPQMAKQIKEFASWWNMIWNSPSYGEFWFQIEHSRSHCHKGRRWLRFREKSSLSSCCTAEQIYIYTIVDSKYDYVLRVESPKYVINYLQNPVEIYSISVGKRATPLTSPDRTRPTSIARGRLDIGPQLWCDVGKLKKSDASLREVLTQCALWYIHLIYVSGHSAVMVNR